MSPLRTLVAADFRRVPRGLTASDRWRAVPLLDTPLGRFSVTLSQPPDTKFAIDSRQVPAAKVIGAANAIAEFLSGNTDAVLAAVQDDYLASCWDEGWMDGCGVPIGLAVAAVCRFLADPTISVRLAEDGGVSSVIYFSPQWDQEHGLYLKVENGRVVQTEP